MQLFKEPPCAFSTTLLSTVPGRAANLTQPRLSATPASSTQPRDRFWAKHATVFPRGFLDFAGSQRQGEREQPASLPLCRARAAPPARGAQLVPLEESRAAVLLPSVRGRLAAPSVPTDAASPQGGLPTLRLTVLPLSPFQATLVAQRRQPQPRAGDIPGCLLGPGPKAVPLHLNR